MGAPFVAHGSMKVRSNSVADSRVFILFNQMDHSQYDAQTFEELFREYYSRLYYYALDWVENEEAAKDIVSGLFGDLWNSFSSWNPDNREAYLARAVRNRCLNYLKHRAVERDTLGKYLTEKQRLIDTDLQEHEELMKRVKGVMDGFPERTRFVVEQCYIEGKKYSELADLMETTPGMIHKHISKALAIFRKALEVKRGRKGTDTVVGES